MELNYDKIFEGHSTVKMPIMSIDSPVMALVKGLEYFVGEDYEWLPCYDSLAKVVGNNQQKGVLILGDNGTGKTTMEKILQRIIVAYFSLVTGRDVTCSFVSAYDMKSAWEHYCAYQIIDDVGMENFSKTYGEQHDYFSQIVDRAEQKGQLLVCSSNLDLEEFAKKYGGRTFDRMKKIFNIVRFSGKSMRV